MLRWKWAVCDWCRGSESAVSQVLMLGAINVTKLVLRFLFVTGVFVGLSPYFKCQMDQWLCDFLSFLSTVATICPLIRLFSYSSLSWFTAFFLGFWLLVEKGTWAPDICYWSGSSLIINISPDITWWSSSEQALRCSCCVVSHCCNSF